MSKGITLSPNHGLNPTLGICFWCGEDDGTIGLAGHLPGDVEAPRRAVISWEPCPECRAQMAKGITFIEVENNKPTGKWAVVKEEAIGRILKDNVIDEVLKARKCCFAPKDFERFFG